MTAPTRIPDGSTVSVVPFDPAAASEDEVRAVYDVARVCDQEAYPDDPPYPYEEFVDDISFAPAYRVNRRWYAVEDGRVVGRSGLHFARTEENPNLAYFMVEVLPEHRRRHVALRLLEPVVADARAEGRTLLSYEALEGSPGIAFNGAVGGAQKRVWRESHLPTAGLDRRLLREWIDRARERAADYELIGWDGPTPEHLREQFVDVETVMNTAPREDFEEDDWRPTVEQLVDTEAQRVAQGTTWWTLAVVHRPTQVMAGFTALHFGRWRPWIGWQGDTGVDPQHRNLGLGRWLKAAMLERLLDERPEVTSVRTFNAGSNDAMLHINVALGFAPALHWTEWQVELDVLAAQVADRLR